MSSRSMGVPNVVLSRRTNSWVSVEGQLLEHPRRRHDVAGLLLEQVEELLLARQQTEHLATSSRRSRDGGRCAGASRRGSTNRADSNEGLEGCQRGLGGRSALYTTRFRALGRARIDSPRRRWLRWRRETGGACRRAHGAVSPVRQARPLERKHAPAVLLTRLPADRSRRLDR